MKFDVIYPSIEEVKPYYRNTKVHSKSQIADIARSIRDFGFDQPVVVDQEMIIIKGHGRYYAAVKIGMKNIPTIKREDLTPAQVMASRIADNKLFEMTSVDAQVQSDELDDIAKSLSASTDDLDFVPTPPTAPDAAVIDSGYGIDPKGKHTASDMDEGPGMSLEDGELVVCPKCVHSFYIAEG